MVFDATFNNSSVISWQSVLLEEETGLPSENHRKLLTILINYCCLEYTSLSARFELIILVVIGTECTGSCKSIYDQDHDGPYGTMNSPYLITYNIQSELKVNLH